MQILHNLFLMTADTESTVDDLDDTDDLDHDLSELWIFSFSKKYLVQGYRKFDISIFMCRIFRCDIQHDGTAVFSTKLSKKSHSSQPRCIF